MGIRHRSTARPNFYFGGFGPNSEFVVRQKHYANFVNFGRGQRNYVNFDQFVVKFCLREFVYELTSSWPPAREEGRVAAAVPDTGSAPIPRDTVDPRAKMGSA